MIIRIILLTLAMSLTLMGCKQRPWTQSSKLSTHAARSGHVINTLRPGLHGDIRRLSAPRVRATSATTARPYALDSGDRLRVTVFGQQGLANNHAIQKEQNNGETTPP